MAAKPTQTRRERVEEREAVIRAAARDMFLENGFDGARMTEIAARAGVAEGTVYLYFRNKRALLDAVIAQFYENLTDGAKAGVEKIPDTFGRFEFLARHHLTQCLAELKILDLMIGMYRQSPEYEQQGYRLNKTYVAVFDGVYREGQARGEIRQDLPLWIVRDLFYGTLEYAIRTLILRGRSKKEMDVAVRSTVEVLRRGITAQHDVSDESEIESIARRLKAVTADLEAAGRINPVRSRTPEKT